MALVSPAILTRLINKPLKTLYGHFSGKQGEVQSCEALSSPAEQSRLMSMCWLALYSSAGDIHANE